MPIFPPRALSRCILSSLLYAGLVLSGAMTLGSAATIAVGVLPPARVKMSPNMVMTTDDRSLVNLRKEDPRLRFDIRYATKNNFTGQVVYDRPGCYLHRNAAKALKQVETDLAAKGLGLLIFDGYRPPSAQRRFWQLVPDERYVSPPGKGGRHTRGTAIDVTLIDLKTGKELPMASAFDDFSERAHVDNDDVSDEVDDNRDLLIDAMERRGFKVLSTEWWHFDYKGWQQYPIIDTTFARLAARK